MYAASARTFLQSARSYPEWVAAARACDESNGASSWRLDEESPDFDAVSVRERLENIRALLAAGADRALLFMLNEGIHGNMDGIASDALWRQAKFGTKKLVEDYVAVLAEALTFIAELPAKRMNYAAKAKFFGRVDCCFGSTAFLMSGSGSLLFFHIGVAKALFNQGLLPSVISGSSGGSVVAGLLGSFPDSELLAQLEAIRPVRSKGDSGGRLRSLGFVAQVDLENWISGLIPDLTFQEAFERTGRCLNISVASDDRHHNGRLLNAITSPNVFIRQAIMASCAVPGLYKPVALMARDDAGNRVPYLPQRRWIDGSVSHDLPTKRLSRLYGINHTIVSQANPMVVPFAFEEKGAASIIQALQRATLVTAKAWFNVNMRLIEQPLSMFPSLLSSTKTTMSLINQEYSGDINIILPAFTLPPHKLLSNLSPDEIAGLIAAGERAAWPKIEMVRVQTLIGRTLAPIVAKYGSHDVARAKVTS